MASGPGKVSFSFGKIIKKPTLQVQPKEIVKKVYKIEFIDSIEDNSVQVINAEIPDEKGPLVIPLLHPNLLLQSVIDTVNSRSKNKSNRAEDAQEQNNEGAKRTGVETLDEIAAREILEDANKEVTKKSEPSTHVVPLVQDIADQKESTLEDYENVPVDDFGLAMLRGMGWDPKKGIGKNGQVVKVTGPTIRPKGLGLGADKAVAAQKPVGKNVSDKAVLGKGSKVRVTFGPHKNLYGTIEGFNDDAGRVDVFMALSSERISINESFVQLVTIDEFNKFGKVININAYNNYKDKETNKSETNDSQNDHSSNIRMRNESNRNGKSLNPDDSSRRQSSAKSKYSNSDSEKSDEKYSKKDNFKYSSNNHNYKKHDLDQNLDDKNKQRSRNYKEYSRDQEKKYSSRDNMHSKHEPKKNYVSKKYSSDSESDSEYEDNRSKHKSKESRNRSKNSRRDRKYSSSDSEYEKKKKHKKTKKKKDRSRSRSKNRR